MSTGDSPTDAFMPLKVNAVRNETEDAKTLAFDVPAARRERFMFAAGQYLTLRDRIDGQLVVRSYSICSAEQDGELRIAVKRVKGGVFSNHVNDDVQVGHVFEAMSPRGEFRLPPKAANSYLFIAVGSGITPVLSLIKTALHSDPGCQVTLIYGNKSTATTMFANSLFFVKNAYMDRFQWISIYSQQPQQNPLLHGRIDNRKGRELNRRLIDIARYEQFYLCGPESMVSEVSRGLADIGIDGGRIHFELFSTSVEDARIVAQKHRARAKQHAGKSSEMQIVHAGREYRFTLPQDGENVLDAGIRHGADLPYSCKSGICATCKCRLLAGDVTMDVNHGLDPELLKQGYVLSCQSHPVSKTVLLDFDQS